MNPTTRMTLQAKLAEHEALVRARKQLKSAWEMLYPHDALDRERGAMRKALDDLDDEVWDSASAIGRWLLENP